MTKKLEEILNLPNVKEAFKEVDKKEKDKDNVVDAEVVDAKEDKEKRA